MTAISAVCSFLCTLVGLHISKQIYKTSVEPDLLLYKMSCILYYIDSICILMAVR